MPVAFSSTITSPALGPPISSSTISSGCPAANATAALVNMSTTFLVHAVYSKLACARSGGYRMPAGHVFKTAFRVCAPIAAVLALCSSAPAAQQKQQVDVKLVLAVDVSPSID